ncbi:MAG: UDP-N-acetylmuramoyl-L-alanyl-D-glutamate--2,6-diaminopimelate ligase [Myxococcota bacterium]
MLSALAQELSAFMAVEQRGTDVEVSGVRRDSRAVQAGDLFAAIPGANVDGARFVPAAKKAGASAVLAAHALDASVPHLVVANVREALARSAHALYGHPAESLEVIGITGTNGKTTCAWLIDAMLSSLGKAPALLGTVAQRAGEARTPASFTTPEADDLARFVRSAVAAGSTHLVMEVSSHGLVQHRVTGVRFRVAAFTNLSQDHLDFHKTMRAYGEAKATLFRNHQPAVSVINVDDPFGAGLAAQLTTPVIRCSGQGRSSDLRASDVRYDRNGIRAQLHYDGETVALESPLVGRHNLENLLTSVGVALGLDVPLVDAAAALRNAVGAPGRMERVPSKGAAILVDYAHTPDALTNALATLRPITTGRLIVVFGCGGDRDAGKRPKMGAAASAADLAIVTSDNPRTEEPAAIVSAILPGMTVPKVSDLAKNGYTVEVDRRKAIALAIHAAQDNDTVLIAGKGHEDYQIVGTQKFPFDDREVAKEALEGVG